MAFNSYSDVEAALRAESDVWSKGQGHTDESVRQNALSAREWWNNYQNQQSPTLSPPPPPPPATPLNTWISTPSYRAPSGIKQAQPDIVLDPNIDTSGDYIVERFFEELGGTELINLSRYDLIDGISVNYNPIANLSRLRRRFNPNNLIALDILSDDEFSKFSIDLLSRGIYEPFFNDDGNLVVEVDIIRSEENIDVEISLSGTLTRIEL
jgi:hypothetical protein